jgi:hypothetical protein
MKEYGCLLLFPEPFPQRLGHLLQGEGCAGLTQQQLAAVAAGGAVVLYAMMAERRALLGGIRRVAGGLLGGVSELARLALQLNPNPVAAAMAARQ